MAILTLPRASNPLSNKNTTPRNKKNIPKPERPIPISGGEKGRNGIEQLDWVLTCNWNEFESQFFQNN